MRPMPRRPRNRVVNLECSSKVVSPVVSLGCSSKADNPAGNLVANLGCSNKVVRSARSSSRVG